MRKSLYPIILIGCIWIVLIFIYPKKKNTVSNQYIPTEYVNKKKLKKEFKNKRKEWIENMHRAHPGDDWKAMDRKNRKTNTNTEPPVCNKMQKKRNRTETLKHGFLKTDLNGETDQNGAGQKRYA